MRNKSKTDFYYSTFRIYEKDLNERLSAEFARSGLRDKTAFLLELIEIGLREKENATTADTVTSIDRITEIERSVKKTELEVLKNTVTIIVLKKLLCNIYYMVFAQQFDEYIAKADLAFGDYDYLPERLRDELDTMLRELDGT